MATKLFNYFKKHLTSDVVKKSSEDQLRDRIISNKIIFECVACDQYSFATENQKFFWLSKMIQNTHILLNDFEDTNNELYEEAAVLTCAIGLIFVREFFFTNANSEVLSELDHCEMLSEPFRLLPCGLVLYMLSKYLQARRKYEIKDYKSAFFKIEEASNAFEEYKNNCNVEPKDLLALLQHENTNWKQFQTENPEILIYNVYYTRLKTILKLDAVNLYQKKALLGLKSAFRLFNGARLTNILVTVAHEFLRHGHFAQVNHLISCGMHFINDGKREKLKILQLCYYHTLICDSISLVEPHSLYKFIVMAPKSLENSIFMRISHKPEVIENEKIHPTEPNNDIQTILEYFSLAGKLLRDLYDCTNLKLDDKELLEAIHIHLGNFYDNFGDWTLAGMVN